MFIWGSGHKTIGVPTSVKMYCMKCGSTTDHAATIEYDYDHIFWICKGSKNRQATTQCARCQQISSMDADAQKDLFAKIGGNPIPFMDRYGGHVLILIIIVYMGFAFLFPCAINPNSQLCADSKVVAE